MISNTQGGTPVATAQPIPAPAAPPSPQLVYRGLVSRGEILNQQLQTAQRLRQELVGQLADQDQTQATRASLEKRVVSVDAQIAELDKQIAQSNLAVAQAAAVPGATVRPPQPPRSGPPEEFFVLTGLFMVIVLFPMSIAFARRIWRRSAKATVTLPPEMSQRMENLERGVEAIAIEVERIGEGQRFVAQMVAERAEGRALGPGAAEPIRIRERERVEERR